MTDATPALSLEQKVKKEIAALDAKATELLANANFINGAKQAFTKMLAHIEAEAKIVEAAAQKEFEAPKTPPAE